MNLQEELKALRKRIAELEELVKEEQEFPQKYDFYWYVDDDTEVLGKNWHNNEYDQGRLSIDNVFRTKEQAEFAVEKLKVEAELRKFSRPFTWREKNWFLTMDSDKDILIEYDDYGAYQGTIYFESKEKAQQAIEAVGVDRIKKYIFGVED